MNKLSKIDHDIYIPFFDENNDIFVDKSPYIKYQRNCIEYECRCKAGSYFYNNQSFKQHIKSKTHKDYINNYKKYYKQVDDMSKLLKERDIELELCKRKIFRLEHKLQEIENISNNEIFYDCI